MEGKTSTSNEGSKINREKSSTISHNGRTFTEAKSRNVSDRKMEEILNSKGFENFDLNVLAVSFIDNIKTVDDEIAETNSFATYEFDLSQIQVNWVPLKPVPEEKKEKIDKRRDKEKAKRAKAKEEREAREAEEAEAIKRRKEIEKTDNAEARRNQIQMTTREIEDDKDAI